LGCHPVYERPQVFRQIDHSALLDIKAFPWLPAKGFLDLFLALNKHATGEELDRSII
jgi:hypothetical protein